MTTVEKDSLKSLSFVLEDCLLLISGLMSIYDQYTVMSDYAKYDLLFDLHILMFFYTKNSFLWWFEFYLVFYVIIAFVKF